MDRTASPFQVRNVGTAESITVRVQGEEVKVPPGQTLVTGRVTLPGDVRIMQRAGQLIDVLAVGDTMVMAPIAGTDSPETAEHLGATRRLKERVMELRTHFNRGLAHTTTVAKRAVPLWAFVGALLFVLSMLPWPPPGWATFAEDLERLQGERGTFETSDSGRYAVVRAGEQSFWRLNTGTGEVSLCGFVDAPARTDNGEPSLDDQGKPKQVPAFRCVRLQER